MTESRLRDRLFSDNQGENRIAQVVVALGDLVFTNQTVAELVARKYEAVALSNPLNALGAVENAVRVELLITSTTHAEGQSNGVSLALMARSEHPEVKVIFVGTPDQVPYTDGLGTFLTSPTTVEEVVETTVRLLS